MSPSASPEDVPEHKSLPKWEIGSMSAWSRYPATSRPAYRLISAGAPYVTTRFSWHDRLIEDFNS